MRFPAGSGISFLLVPIALFGCGGGDETSAPSPSQAPEDSGAPLSTPPTAEEAELTRAAERIVGFLRGQIGFERIDLADSVTLRLGPEAGGEEATRHRAELERPESWQIPSAGLRTTVSLVPPEGLTHSTVQPGTHFRCFPTPLSTVSEELASFPHVGVRLEPPEAASCLQVWNLTLVFAPGTAPPELVAVVYDQFEW